jgi:hypothetical protein
MYSLPFLCRLKTVTPGGTTRIGGIRKRSAKTLQEVREHVQQRLEIFAPGGGYVFNQVHNIQRNVPTENVFAMLDAAREFGEYAKG